MKLENKAKNVKNCDECGKESNVTTLIYKKLVGKKYKTESISKCENCK